MHHFSAGILRLLENFLQRTKVAQGSHKIGKPNEQVIFKKVFYLSSERAVFHIILD